MKFPVYQSSCCQFKTLKLALRIPLLSDLRHGCFATCFTVENRQMLRLSFHYSVGSWHQYRFRFHLQCLNVWIILTNSKFSNAIPRFQNNFNAFDVFQFSNALASPMQCSKFPRQKSPANNRYQYNRTNSLVNQVCYQTLVWRRWIYRQTVFTARFHS